MAPACNPATLEVTQENLGFEVSLSYMGRLFQKRKKEERKEGWMDEWIDGGRKESRQEGRKGRKGNRVIKSLKIAHLYVRILVLTV